MSLLDAIAAHIAEATQQAFHISSHTAMGGGCINSAYRLDGDNKSYFVKINSADRLNMFEAEAAGLADIAQSYTIKVPAPVCWHVIGDSSFLVLENMEFGSSGSHAMQTFGQQLAHMHQTTSDHFGWRMDNTIGSTPQVNHRSDNWAQFWREQRLAFQLEQAAQKGYRGRLQHDGEKLLVCLDHFFERYHPQPSLLHGDLWSGNYAIDTNGDPVIYDPAVYYGDREADIAMTELFGGFGQSFYSAYNEIFPLDKDYAVRKTLYNLYHIINHLNLFGGAYLSQAEAMIARLLSECR